MQQKRLTDAESELIQLRANDHKKTLCMKQLEQMIPNVVDEWKQKEDDYKVKLTNATQQLKQTEQSNREKALQEKQQFDERINEKDATIDRLTKENERRKQDYDSLQPQMRQYEQRVQQLTRDAEQVVARSLARIAYGEMILLLGQDAVVGAGERLAQSDSKRRNPLGYSPIGVRREAARDRADAARTSEGQY